MRNSGVNHPRIQSLGYDLGYEIRSLFFITIYCFMVSANVTAADMHFFLEDPDGQLESRGQMEVGSPFREMLTNVGLYYGSRFESNVVFKVRVTASSVGGGSASGNPLRRGEGEFLVVDGEQSFVRPVHLALLQAQGEELGLDACEVHAEVKLDITKLESFSRTLNDIIGGSIASIMIHEFGHSILGITSERGNTYDIPYYIPPWDFLLELDSEIPDQYRAGGDRVDAVLGEKVLLSEPYRGGAFSHIGHGQPFRIVENGFKSIITNNIGPPNDGLHAGLSVMGGNFYPDGASLKPVDAALAADIGFEMRPLNASVVLHPQLIESFELGFENIVEIPFLDVGGDIYTAHLRWTGINENGLNNFALQGLSSEGDVALAKLAPGAPEAMNSQPALFDGQQILVPLMEVYLDGEIQMFKDVVFERDGNDDLPLNFVITSIADESPPIPDTEVLIITDCEG